MKCVCGTEIDKEFQHDCITFCVSCHRKIVFNNPKQMIEQEKRNHFREIIKTTGSLPTFHVHELLSALDERDREVERSNDRRKQLRESRRFWREEHDKLLLENQRLRKALEEIADQAVIDPIFREVARQALSGDTK